MFLFLSTIAAIIIVTGVIYILYILYREMMSPIHPVLGKVWIAASLFSLFLALVSECYSVKQRAKKAAEQEAALDLADMVPLQKISLVDVK